MAHLKSNDIGNDPIEVRLYRLLRMQNNINSQRVELGISGPLSKGDLGGFFSAEASRVASSTTIIIAALADLNKLNSDVENQP